MIRGGDFIELGLACAGVCKTLDRGVKGREEAKLSLATFETIERLTTQVESTVHTCSDTLTKFPIAEFLPRFKGMSSSLVNEVWSVAFSMRRAINTRSPPGGWA